MLRPARRSIGAGPRVWGGRRPSNGMNTAMNLLSVAGAGIAVAAALSASAASAFTVEIEEPLRLILFHETTGEQILGPVTYTATWTGSEAPISPGGDAYDVAGSVTFGGYPLPLLRVEMGASDSRLSLSFILDETPGVYVCSPYPYCATLDQNPDGVPFSGVDLNSIAITLDAGYGLLTNPSQIPPQSMNLAEINQVRSRYNYFTTGLYKQYTSQIWFNDTPIVRQVFPSGNDGPPGAVETVPLPGGLALLGLGLAGLARLRGRRS